MNVVFCLIVAGQDMLERMVGNGVIQVPHTLSHNEPESLHSISEPILVGIKYLHIHWIPTYTTRDPQFCFPNPLMLSLYFQLLATQSMPASQVDVTVITCQSTSNLEASCLCVILSGAVCRNRHVTCRACSNELPGKPQSSICLGARTKSTYLKLWKQKLTRTPKHAHGRDI